MPSSAAAAAAAAAAARLAPLSGPDLVEHLRTTTSRADWDAAKRVLRDRDRMLAEAQANAAAAKTGLAELGAEVQALKERFFQQKRAQERRGPGPGSGAIAAAAPLVRRRAVEPGPEGAIIDLCSSDDDDEEEELEEGKFRLRPVGVAGVSCNRKEEPAAASKGDQGRRAGVSCQQQQESASKGDEERTPAGMSCKRKAPASSCSPDDEDDRVPLSQLFMKKQSKAQPGANGKPNKGRGDAQVNSAGLLGVDQPAISPVNRGIPEAVAERMLGRPDDPKAAAFVQGTGNGQSGKNVGLSRAMPSPLPTASTAGNSPSKNCSKPDGSEGRKRIGEKEGRSVARQENDAPLQVRTPRLIDTARKIVGSARVGAETPMEHTDSSSDKIVNVVHKSVEGQEKGIDEVHKTKVSLETNAPGNRGQVLNKKVLSRAEVIREQGSKLSPDQSRMDTPENQLALHSEPMSAESSLPLAVTRNWKSSSDVFGSCLGNYELCMQAACALHRQQKITTLGGRLTKYDAHRLAMLAEFLLDGNLQGPLKRTVEDLEKHDFAEFDFLERTVMLFSQQLFSIYKNKDDKYFR